MKLKINKKKWINLFLIIIVITIIGKTTLDIIKKGTISDTYMASLFGFAGVLIGAYTVRKNKQEDIKNDPYYREN